MSRRFTIGLLLLLDDVSRARQLAQVATAGAKLFPGRDLELHEPAAWDLTPDEWQALARKLAG